MTVEGALEKGRRAVERVMKDACTIVNPADERTSTLNEATGQRVQPNPSDPVYSGRCAARSTGLEERVEGRQTVLVETFRLVLPWDAPIPASGATVTMTASLRPNLVDVVGHVTGVPDSGTVAPYVVIDFERLVRSIPSP